MRFEEDGITSTYKAKQPEVPGHGMGVDWASPGEDHSVSRRQLPCGCWVPLDHEGPCPVHGSANLEGPDLQAGREEEFRAVLLDLVNLICNQMIAIKHQGPPSWLDEVAARIMARIVTDPAHVRAAVAEGFASPGQLASAMAEASYMYAQAHLNEGKRRREAKGE